MFARAYARQSLGADDAPQESAAGPLEIATPPQWAPVVLRHPLRLLSDHAHLEKKAANNALDLLNRWIAPGEAPPPEIWYRRLSSIAREEAAHLAQVLRLLHQRGGRLARFHRNRYAGDLQKLLRPGSASPRAELVDRLLISALIEARSAERFALLAPAARAAGDAELGGFYRRLYRSEARHYWSFMELADLVDSAERKRRWPELLAAEARIIVRQKLRPAILSGPGRLQIICRT